MEGLEEIQAGIQTGLANVKEEIAKDLKEIVNDATAQKFTDLEGEIKDIRGDLMKRFVDDPADHAKQLVKDLEKKLDEIEAKQAEFAEQARLARVPQTVQKDADGNPILDYGGVIVRESQELRDFLMSYHAPGFKAAKEAEFRALGTGLFATGGQLPPEVQDAFIDFVIAQQATLPNVTTIRMNAPTGYTDELRVAARKMRAATEGVAPTSADSITTKRRTLTTVEVIWGEDITFTLLEDAIERMGTESHIARLIATGFGNDANDLAWNGDESLSDPFLSINDGWFKLFTDDAEVNDIDFSTSPIPATPAEAMQQMMQAMPVNFLGRTDHRFFCSIPFAMNHADDLSVRETALGDQVMVNGFPALRYFGIPLNPDSHIASATQRVVLCPQGNLFHGVQRLFRMDTEWRPRNRWIEYTLTARNDYEYATGKAVVNGTSVPTAFN